MHQPDIRFDYDKKTDVLHITLGTGEPSYCEEVDDILLVERGMFSHQITGFQIMDIEFHKFKKIEILGYIEKAAEEFKQQIRENMRLADRLPDLIDKNLKWRRLPIREKAH